MLFDIIFLIDCFGVNFNTAVYTESGQLSYDRVTIAKTYLQFWFWIDFPSSVPLSQGFKIAALVQGASSGDDQRLLNSIKLLRLARILKLIRLMKAAKIFKLLEDELDINMSFLKLLKLFFAVLFICHLVGCIAYWAISAQDPYIYGMFRPQRWWGCELAPWAPNDFGLEVLTKESIFKEDPHEEFELLTGVPRAPDDFCDQSPGSGERWMTKMEKGWIYLWVLYWTITTMTTIGYGDFSPKTPLEVIITIIVQLFGAVLFGWIIGNIANLLADFNQYETAYKLRMEQIKAYLSHKKVPWPLRKSVKKYCSHYFARKGVMREDWNILPPLLKREIVRFEHADVLTSFPRLADRENEECMHRLLDFVRPMHVPAGTYFINGAIDPCTEMYFVQEGYVVVLDKFAREMKSATGGCTGSANKARGSSSRGWQLSVFRKSKTDSDAPGDESSRSENPTSHAQPQVTRKPRRYTSFGGSKVLDVKRTGSWFGHVELIGEYDVAEEVGMDDSMYQDAEWQNTYKARTACDLMILVKHDLFLLMDEYPYLKDVLDEEPAVVSPSSACRTDASIDDADSTVASHVQNVYVETASALNESRPPPALPLDHGGKGALEAIPDGVKSNKFNAACTGNLEEGSKSNRRSSGSFSQGRASRFGTQSTERVVLTKASGCCPKSAAKSPKLTGAGGSGPQMVGASSSAQPSSQRSGWQKARRLRNEITSMSQAAAEAKTTAASGSSSDWMKQRIAVDILGDAAVEPSKIDDDALFERLQTLISHANAVIDDQQGRPSDGSQSFGTASVSSLTSSSTGLHHAQELQLHSLLLSMQKSVQDSADMVRTFIDQAEAGAVDTSRAD